VKNEKVRNGWIEDYQTLKDRASERFGEEGVRRLQEIISKLATYHYNKNKYLLLGREKELYNFLIENGYNPFTVYRWALLERLPDDLRFQLKQGAISQKIASKIRFKRRHESKNKVCMDIRLMGLKLVGSM